MKHGELVLTAWPTHPRLFYVDVLHLAKWVNVLGIWLENVEDVVSWFAEFVQQLSHAFQTHLTLKQ